MTCSIMGGILALTRAIHSTSVLPALVLHPAFRPEITAPGGEVKRLFLQPDGGLIVFGRFDALSGGGRGNLARLNPDGSVEESYPAPAP